MFVSLHTKSEHSLGYGTAPVDQLLRGAADCGYPALALTDVENLYGQIKFHHAARALGVKAITGVELRAGYWSHALGQKTGRLVLLARDRDGYESLCRIITRRRAVRTPRNDEPLQCLEAAPRGLFYLSDDAAVLQQLARAGVAADDLRFLLVRPGGGEPPPGMRAVASADTVMAQPGDWGLHTLQTAIRVQQKISLPMEARLPRYFLPAPRDVSRRFPDAPAAVAETIQLAEACCFDLCTLRPSWPSSEQASGESAEARLQSICRQRFKAGRDAGKWARAVYLQRLNQELSVLGRLGLAGYLMIVAEITDQARRRGMALASRGSAASSLVLHVLGITSVDPVQHGLHFERFVNADRGEPPDVDLDLPSDRRDELIAWVFQRFGQERVAMVSTHQTFGWRGAFREGLKAFGLALSAVDRFCREIPEHEADAREIAALAYRLLPRPYRDAVPLIARLVGKPQHIGVHPGGVVIAQPRLDVYAPLELAPKGVAVIQYDMHSLQKIGMIKIDLLGNRALSAISETLRSAGPLEMPDGDPATLETLKLARTVSCFQIETPTLRATLRKLPVQDIQDLIGALAIVRPGPASSQAKAAFIRRANGEEPPHAPHPRLSAALKETYGMMLYEEDFMTAIVALTGWSLKRADRARAAIIRHHEDAAVMARLESEFIKASVQNGVSADEAAPLWIELSRFAMYSFNKAHAASYAQLAWQTAYLKTHHPAAFACAVLNHYGGCYPLRTLVADFARQGVRFRAPHVNFSQHHCSLEAGAVRIGLSSIKHLTVKSRHQIFAARPYRDFVDFLRRTSLNFRELESLVLCGACDELAPLSSCTYPVTHEELLARLRDCRDSQALKGFVPRFAAGPYGETYAALVRARNEAAILGICLHDHPMQVLRQEARRNECVTIEELHRWTNRPVRIAALIAATQRVKKVDGSIMQYATFEDETGLVEAILTPAVYSSLANPLTDPGPFLIAGCVGEDYRDIQLVVSQVTPFHQRPHIYMM